MRNTEASHQKWLFYCHFADYSSKRACVCIVLTIPLPKDHQKRWSDCIGLTTSYSLADHTKIIEKLGGIGDEAS